MYVDDEQRAFLDGLQVGDLVVVARSWREWCVRHVDRVTASRVWVTGSQFDRKTGREWGASSSIYRHDTLQITAERIESARMEVFSAKEAAARKVLLASIVPALNAAPLAVLEQIQSLLGSAGGSHGRDT